FVEFCREHAEALRATLRTHSTQTNEVGRCAYLLPCIASAADADWLRACVFADQPERLERLDAALAIAREHPPPLVEGDALSLLPDILERVPAGMQPIVFH